MSTINEVDLVNVFILKSIVCQFLPRVDIIICKFFFKRDSMFSAVRLKKKCICLYRQLAKMS